MKCNVNYLNFTTVVVRGDVEEIRTTVNDDDDEDHAQQEKQDAQLS